MSFLANHIQIRNGNYQDMIFHNVYKPIKSDLDARIEADSSNKDILENEKVDFVITENEIEDYDDDDDLTDNLFVELTDEERDDELYQNDSCPSDQDLVKSSTLVTLQSTTEHNDNTVLDVTAKSIKPVPILFEDVSSSELRTREQHVPPEDIVSENYQVVSKAAESRCEDVIFGELVTSMLKKMDSPNRKRAKKEILNILLS